MKSIDSIIINIHQNLYLYPPLNFVSGPSALLPNFITLINRNRVNLILANHLSVTNAPPTSDKSIHSPKPSILSQTYRMDIDNDDEILRTLAQGQPID